MAFPNVVARNETATTTAATTITVPFTQTTNDLVVILLAAPSVISISSNDEGFTSFVSSGGHAFGLYKVLDGSEGGDVVITLSASVKAAAVSYNIQGSDGAAPETSATSGTSTTPDPPSLTPVNGSKDYLWLAFVRQAGEELDDDTWCTAAPTDFTNLLQKTTGTGGAASTNCSAASAERQFTGSVLDPGTFTVAQSLAWRTITISIAPTSGAAAVDPFPYINGGYFPCEG